MTIARIEKGQVVEQREDIALSDVPAHKRSQWRTVIGNPPSYDPKTEILTGPSYSVGEDSVVKSWSITKRSKEDLVALVRAEAQRRIIALMGARDLENCFIKQFNANMRANELNDKRVSGETLTQEEESEANVLRNMAISIKAIRTASNVLEEMDDIPSDFADDSRWP